MSHLKPVQVGAPPPVHLPERVIAPVHFNSFAELSTTKATAVRSPELSFFGHKWIIELYPGGDDNTSIDGYVALWIENLTEKCIEVDCTIVIKHPNGGKDLIRLGGMTKFSSKGFDPVIKETKVKK